MSTGAEEGGTALRTALLTTLADVVETVPGTAPPWPVTRARLVRVARRRRWRRSAVTFGCAVLVAAGVLQVGRTPLRPANRPDQVGSGSDAPATGRPGRAGFPLTGQEAWLLAFRQAVIGQPPSWVEAPSVAAPGDPADPAAWAYQAVRLDQVQVQGAEELGGLRVVQVLVSQSYREHSTGPLLEARDRARYAGHAGAAPQDMVVLRGDRESAAWPDPTAPGWVDVLGTRMVEHVELRVRDAAGVERSVAFGGSMMARVYAPGARFVQLVEPGGDLQLTLPVQSLDLVAMRAAPAGH